MGFLRAPVAAAGWGKARRQEEARAPVWRWSGRLGEAVAGGRKALLPCRGHSVAITPLGGRFSASAELEPPLFVEASFVGPASPQLWAWGGGSFLSRSG